MKKDKVLTSLLILMVMVMFSACSKQEGGTYGSIIPEKNGLMVSILNQDSGETTTKFIKVTGFKDSTIEQELNDELYAFSTWGLESDDEVTIEYAIQGDFISVRRYITKYTADAAYPTNILQTQIYDLSTGCQAGDIKDFVVIGEELKKLILSGAFTQTYPSEIDGAAERLAEEIVDKHDPEYFDLRFYLTETGLGFYMEVTHAEGDYWTFEASYEDIESILCEKLLSTISK